MIDDDLDSHFDSLRDAIFEDDIGHLKHLLSLYPINIDQPDPGGQTLLHLACFWGRRDIAKHLLDQNASMTITNNAGCTSLDLATHWGHSELAEMLRMRGASSVWEERFRFFQIKNEDLLHEVEHYRNLYKTKTNELTAAQKDCQNVQLALDLEKQAHLNSITRLKELEKAQYDWILEKENLKLQRQKALDDYDSVFIERKKMELERDHAVKEQKTIHQLYTSMSKSMQDCTTNEQEMLKKWKCAEAAAVVADSQRNFAQAKEKVLQKKLHAALSEVYLTTERLNQAEDELMALKMNLGEYIYEHKYKELLRLKAQRAKQVGISQHRQAQNHQDTNPQNKKSLRNISAGKKFQVSDQIENNKHKKSISVRPSTVPVESDQQDNSIAINLATLIVTDKSKFSLAARQYAKQLRSSETKKLRERIKKLSEVEQACITQEAGIINMEPNNFQQEFVSTINNFSTKQLAKWGLEEIDIERHLMCSRGALEPIYTKTHAPISNEINIDRNVDYYSLTQGQLEQTKRTVDYSIYKPHLLPKSPQLEDFLSLPAQKMTEKSSNANCLPTTMQRRILSSFYTAKSEE